jgi:Late exocytosis, associated with Golgi transport
LNIADKLDDDQKAWHVLERLGIHTKEQILKANWFKIIWKVDEEDLQELQGTDLVIYMKFMKYMAYLFGIIMCLNLVVLMPVYSAKLQKPAGSQIHISDYSLLAILYYYSPET